VKPLVIVLIVLIGMWVVSRCAGGGGFGKGAKLLLALVLLIVLGVVYVLLE